MTALAQYQRLESSGLWRADAGAQRREVVVSFGDASLVLTDMAGTALAHWSLAAIERLNPGAGPALFSPAAEDDETLEIADPTMVDAIEKVRGAVDRRRSRRRRLGLPMLGLSVAAVVALGVFWLPGALRRHTVSVVPEAGRVEIGRRMLAEIRHIAGPPCRTPRGGLALAELAARLLPGAGWRLAVLPDGLTGAVHLPGRRILLGRELVENNPDPDVAAGHILAEAARAARTDPLARLLRGAGPVASLRMLTTGHLPDPVLAEAAERWLTEPARPLPETALLARFERAGVASTPYAYAEDISGESVPGLVAADPMRGAEGPPLLPDADWAALRNICAP